MKTQFLILILSSFFYMQSFASGIAIVDGTEGIYFETISSHTSVFVKDQIAIITSTQTFKNTTGAAQEFKYGFPLVVGANPTSLRWNYENNWQSAEVNSDAQDNSIPGNGGGSGNGILYDIEDYLGGFPFFFAPNNEVANDSTITVELVYVQLLPYFQSKVSFYQKNNFSEIQNIPVLDQSFQFVLESDRTVLNIALLNLDFEISTQGNQTTVSSQIDEQIADLIMSLNTNLNQMP